MNSIGCTYVDYLGPLSLTINELLRSYRKILLQAHFRHVLMVQVTLTKLIFV